MKKNYFKESIDLFLLSFKKININLIYPIFYDSLFYLTAGFAFVIWLFILKSQSSLLRDTYTGIFSIDFSSLSALDLNYIQNSIPIMRNFFLFAILSVVGWVIFITLITSLFKGPIWCKVCREKLTIRFFIKFFLLNSIWLISWLAAAFIIAVGIKEDIALYLITLLVMLFLYLTPFLFIFFAKNKRLSAIKGAFSFGIRKIHYFILPYLLAVIVFLAVSQLYWLYRLLPDKVEIAITALIFLAFLAWLRAYIYDVFIAVSKAGYIT